MAAAVIVGGSVAGLGAALGLAAAGHDVTILERDGPTTVGSGVEAFASWERPHVPQFRQPHTILARARNLLDEQAPAVGARLRDDGVEEVNFLKMFTPPERQRPEDDAFTAWITRRPAFELALLRTVEATSGIDLRHGTTVTGLLLDEARPGVSVVGVETDRGPVPADVVIDAGGRRSPVCGWLRDAGAEVPERVQDCELTYHARHFELRDGADLDLAGLVLLRVELMGVSTITFPGEHRTFSLCLAPASWDVDLKQLRHTWAWDAAARTIPSLAPWVDPGAVGPISDVVTMAGHKNLLRELVVDGRPVALGVLAVGDALCSTNPTNGWGVSMALTTAFAAADAVTRADGDPERQVLLYHDAVGQEVEDVYVESSALDRLRHYRWLGEEVPPSDRHEAERVALLRALSLGAVRDPELGREVLRRVNLLQSPRRTLSDPDLRHRVEAFAATRSEEHGEVGPSRGDLLEAIARARP